MKTISTDRPCGKHKGVELLKLIKYDKFQWKICADLKVVGMVCGLQGGYTKNCCFPCLWDKNFVKALNKESTAFTYLISLFPALSYAKIKEAFLAGPEIKKLLKDNKFTTLLSFKEAAAWKSFRLVVETFLEITKREITKVF